MLGEEARELLGFPPNSRLTLSQVKAAYRKKACESHPDRFPEHEKSSAESKFKLISEAYSCLQSGAEHGNSAGATWVRVVRRGVPTAQTRRNSALIKAPFLLLMFGAISFGGLNASRAYRKQKEEYPSNNPFLP